MALINTILNLIPWTISEVSHFLFRSRPKSVAWFGNTPVTATGLHSEFATILIWINQISNFHQSFRHNAAYAAKRWCVALDFPDLRRNGSSRQIIDASGRWRG